MGQFFKNKKNTTLLVSLLIPLIVTLLLFAGFLNTWELKISDAMYAPSEPLDTIVIISIDDSSLQELGQWPWPRSYIASAINTINSSKVIGVDISFFELTDEDEILAQALTNASVVLAMEYTSFSIQNNELYGEELLVPTTTLGRIGIDYQVGFVNIFTDTDGITRSYTPHIAGIEDYDHFSKVITNLYTGVSQDLGSEKRLIPFYSEPGGFTSISFSDVYNQRVDPSFFKDKIVLIGATAANLHDTVNVPISYQEMPGVEVNANLVQSLVTRDYLNYQDELSTVIVIFLFAIITGLLLYVLRIHYAIGLLVLLSISFIFIAIQLFNTGIIVNILYPLFTMALVFSVLVVYYYLTEEKNRKWITSLFGKYVSPIVIDQLIKNPSLIDLGGEQRNITIFFSDIRGFTAISEQLKPKDLVHLLNEYFTEMTSIILNNQGLMDKYMGDAIMAFWGAPLDQPDHPLLTCKSSLYMIQKQKELQKQWAQRNIPSFEIGIGINSGDAIVGNMGSEKRFDYTAIGDHINLASRLEGLNKIYGTNIIISENTYNLVKNEFVFRKLDSVRVKGKKTAIYIYELFSFKDDVSEADLLFIKKYETGLEYYFQQQWDKAIQSFTAARKQKKNDTASILFIQRCQNFLNQPPAKDWDGVWDMKTK